MWLRFIEPLLRLEKSLFRFAHRGEIFVELLAIARADAALHAFGVFEHRIEHATSFAQPLDLRLLFFGTPLDEHVAEQARRLLDAENSYAACRYGNAAAAEGEIAEPSLQADLLGGQLIERNRIAKIRRAGVRRAGEPSLVGRVAAIDIGVRRAGDHGEVFAQIGERFKVGRGDVVAAGFLRNQIRRMERKFHIDCD